MAFDSQKVKVIVKGIRPLEAFCVAVDSAALKMIVHDIVPVYGLNRLLKGYWNTRWKDDSV